MKKKVEIMAPAGSFESLQAALKAGADSVYFGLEQLNMRTKGAHNFKTSDLAKIVEICQKAGVKSYLTLNTILYDQDLALMKRMINQAQKNRVTAVIASDLAAIQYAHSLNQPVHISTQQNISNFEAVKFFSRYADVLVLARELSLNQIKKIINQIKKEGIKGPAGQLIQIELFAHGALCMSIAGKCYLSLGLYNSSANRGACLQPCRRAYRLIDQETNDELVLDNQYVMSLKDLSTIGFLDQLIKAGVSILKIEGRGRSTDYIYTVTKAYRQAVDSIFKKSYTPAKIAGWTKQLESVFNRGLWSGGYYLGQKLGEWSGSYGSQATNQKIYLGQVKGYFRKKMTVDFLIETGDLRLGETILITGPRTGLIELKVESMFSRNRKRNHLTKGELVSLSLAEKVELKDKVFKVVPK